ncbi:MAG: hypothetical protein ACI4F2_02260 [Acutalibacteraceae bacterium]
MQVTYFYLSVPQSVFLYSLACKYYNACCSCKDKEKHCYVCAVAAEATVNTDAPLTPQGKC